MRRTIKREVFVGSESLGQGLKGYPYVSQVADVATFSGSGEPTLNKRLGRLIDVVRDISGLPVAVLTNSSLMHDKDVRADLAKADIVVAKLDAPNHHLFQEIDSPHPEINFHSMLKGAVVKLARVGDRSKLKCSFCPMFMWIVRFVRVSAITKRLWTSPIKVKISMRF